ncbi:MAG: PH domain-containing protein [Microscillaceae bacterium]|nr:PH domain-containing protein [Microscillaceae bacterium]
MSYVKENLARGERVVHTTHLHWVLFLESLSIVGLGLFISYLGYSYRQALGSFNFVIDYIAMAVLIFGGGKFLIEFIRHQSSEFAVTTRRIIIKVGVLQRKSVSMPLSKIESIEIDQSILGRLLGFGSINITGTGTAESKFDLLNNPGEFRRKMQLVSEGEGQVEEAEDSYIPKPVATRPVRRRRRRR